MRNSIDNLIDLKYQNLKNVINYIRSEEYSTKKGIAENLNLSFATVSNMCNSLEDMGLIEYVTLNDAKVVGRSPKYIHLVKDRLSILNVNAQATREIELIITNLLNEVVFKKKYYYKDTQTYKEFITECNNYYSDFIEEYNIKTEDIIGVGVVVSGIFDKVSQKVVASEIPLFENQPMKADFEAIFDKDVLIDNDANLCAFGAKMEYGRSNLAYIYIGEGVGIGVVQNGEVLKGERGYGPEICHMPIGELDIKCHLCGNKHCLQTDLSFNGFIAKFYANAYDGNKITWDEFVQKVKNGEEKALKVVRDNARVLSIAVTSIASLFHPEKIVIGGDIAECIFDLMKQPILEVINSRKIVNSMDDYDLYYDSDFRTNIIKGISEKIYSEWYLEI